LSLLDLALAAWLADRGRGGCCAVIVASLRWFWRAAPPGLRPARLAEPGSKTICHAAGWRYPDAFRVVDRRESRRRWRKGAFPARNRSPVDTPAQPIAVA